MNEESLKPLIMEVTKCMREQAEIEKRFMDLIRKPIDERGFRTDAERDAAILDFAWGGKK